MRSRGYLTGGIISKAVEDQTFNTTAIQYLQATLEGVTSDPSDIVKVSCIKTLQDFVAKLPKATVQPLQGAIITTVQAFLGGQDPSDLPDSDDIVITVLETIRDIVLVDAQVVLSSPAIDVLFSIASYSASNFQVSCIIEEAFDDIAEEISNSGPEPYAQLCDKVLPSLTGAFDVAGMTSQPDLASLAAELLAALGTYGTWGLPQRFVPAVLPRLNQILLTSEEGELLRPATSSLKHMIKHATDQFFAWSDPTSDKTSLELTLMIIDRLLSGAVADNAASEVGGLAAELVEKAGSERLGPYLIQLLRAVAVRLASAQEAQFIQSLILVFARLSLHSAHEVVDFLASEQGQLELVLGKWLDNSVSFAGYDEIRQNVVALSKLYDLDDERLRHTMVRGDLIVQPSSDRIMTRSKARLNPDTYTSIPIQLKIVKVLVEELSSATTGRGNLDPAALAALEEEGSEDEDEWEDEPSHTLDLGSPGVREGLMAFGGDGANGPSRARDDETQTYLVGWFREQGEKERFRELWGQLSEGEREKLRVVDQSS